MKKHETRGGTAWVRMKTAFAFWSPFQITSQTEMWEIIHSLRISMRHNSSLGVALQPDPTDLTSILIHLGSLECSFTNDALMIQLHLTVYGGCDTEIKPACSWTSHFMLRGVLEMHENSECLRNIIISRLRQQYDDIKKIKNNQPDCWPCALPFPYDLTFTHSLTNIPKEQQNSEHCVARIDHSTIRSIRNACRGGKVANVKSKKPIEGSDKTESYSERGMKFSYVDLCYSYSMLPSFIHSFTTFQTRSVLINRMEIKQILFFVFPSPTKEKCGISGTRGNEEK